jgi:acyl carrier protein
MESSLNGIDVHRLTSWLQGYIAEKCKVPQDMIDISAEFDKLGVDSLMAVGITVEIHERFGIELPPTALFEFNTIESLVEQVLDLRAMQLG